AGMLVADLGDNQAPPRSYDGTVRAAIEAMKEADGPLLPEVEHVIVDEAQDVVGLRAAFVANLLERGVSAECGFTVLGDQAQSLYNFSEKGESRPLIEMLTVSPELQHTELRHHYRARTRAARRHVGLRTLMVGSSPLE